MTRSKARVSSGQPTPFRNRRLLVAVKVASTAANALVSVPGQAAPPVGEARGRADRDPSLPQRPAGTRRNPNRWRGAGPVGASASTACTPAR
jgi:hypothetical protein